MIKVNHKICYKPVIPRSARWHRNCVDWSSFTNDVETKMSNLPNEPNLSLCISCFNDILISTATTYVGKSKPSRRSKPWITPHVQPKIHNRNRLHQTIHQNHQEWTDACHEATEAINEAKQRAGRICFKMRCRTQMVPTCGKISKVSTVLLTLTLLTKLCLTTVERSLILNPKLMSSLTTMPGSTNSKCHNPIVTLTDSLRRVSKYHLLMRAAHQF